MADFVQTQNLYTLSDLCFDEAQVDLQNYHTTTIVMVIPCSVHHLKNYLILDLLNKLKLITYLTEIVVVINGIPSAATEQVLALKALDARITILLESGQDTHLLSDYLAIKSKPLSGKGFALWLGYFYILQKYEKRVLIATLDADLKNFTPALLLKLLFPLVHCAAEFNKGYYVRYSQNKLDGRLTRLLLFPLLQAMRRQTDLTGLLDFLIEFRYPLSGEMAISSDLLRNLNLRTAWSYDLSLLTQIYEYATISSIYQTEISNNHQHQHRDSASDGDHGLQVVAVDIIDYLCGLYPFDFKQLATDYLSIASRFIDQYQLLAAFNGLNFSVEAEKELARRLGLLIHDGNCGSVTLPKINQVSDQAGLRRFITDLII